MATEITTVKFLLEAIRVCESVFIQVRFGTSERWVKISKTEARALAKALPRNATPTESEMPCGFYGTVTDGILSMG